MEGASAPTADRPLAGEADAVVVAEAVRGHHDAMEILFDRYERTVFNIARRCLGDNGEAQDICQQVYLETFSDIDKFDPGKGSFKAWLLRRALHRSINRRQHLEAQGFYKSVEDVENDLVDVATDGNKTRFHMLPAEVSHLTSELLAPLAPRERQVIVLTFSESLTREEVAAELHITVPAVRHSLQKALKIMHAALAKASKGRNGTGKDIRLG